MQVKSDVPGNMGLVPFANSFRHAPFPEKAFRKRRVVSKFLGCSFSVSKTKRNVLENTRYVPLETRFFCVSFPEHPISGHYSRDWSEYVNVIGVISEPFTREFG